MEKIVTFDEGQPHDGFWAEAGGEHCENIGRERSVTFPGNIRKI